MIIETARGSSTCKLTDSAQIEAFGANSTVADAAARAE